MGMPKRGEEREKGRWHYLSYQSDRKAKRPSKRRWKAIKGNLKGWGGWRTGIAGKTFVPRKPPMGTLGSGGARWGGRGAVLLCVNERFRSTNRDQNVLGPHQFHAPPPSIAGFPLTPRYRI